VAEFVCFNCGRPTDLVDEGTGPICRECHNARKGGPSPLEDEEAADLEELTVEELKDELRERDLPVSGTKDELIERLQQAEA
jgi:SAP domain